MGQEKLPFCVVGWGLSLHLLRGAGSSTSIKLSELLCRLLCAFTTAWRPCNIWQLDWALIKGLQSLSVCYKPSTVLGQLPVSRILAHPSGKAAP